jgi:hypothetical protein
MSVLKIQNKTEYTVKLRLDSGAETKIGPRYPGAPIKDWQIELNIPSDFKGESIVIERIE